MKLIGKFVGILAIGAAIFSAPAIAPYNPAHATSMCGSHNDVTSLLSKRYKEARRAIGMVSDEGVMEVFVSSDGTWSIILTSTKGMACIIAAGKNWQEMKEVGAFKGEPT